MMEVKNELGGIVTENPFPIYIQNKSINEFSKKTLYEKIMECDGVFSYSFELKFEMFETHEFLVKKENNAKLYRALISIIIDHENNIKELDPNIKQFCLHIDGLDTPIYIAENNEKDKYLFDILTKIIQYKALPLNKYNFVRVNCDCLSFRLLGYKGSYEKDITNIENLMYYMERDSENYRILKNMVRDIKHHILELDKHIDAVNEITKVFVNRNAYMGIEDHTEYFTKELLDYSDKKHKIIYLDIIKLTVFKLCDDGNLNHYRVEYEITISANGIGYQQFSEDIFVNTQNYINNLFVDVWDGNFMTKIDCVIDANNKITLMNKVTNDDYARKLLEESITKYITNNYRLNEKGE